MLDDLIEYREVKQYTGSIVYFDVTLKKQVAGFSVGIHFEKVVLCENDESLLLIRGPAESFSVSLEEL